MPMTSLPMIAPLLPILRLAAWLALLAVVFVPLERLFAAHPREVFRRGFATDLGYYFLNGIVPAAVLGLPLALLAWAAQRALPAGFVAMMGGLPFGVRVALALVAGEVGYYWGHRWSHEIPFLWKFHAIHHAAEEVDFLVNTHAHPVDVVFSRLCGFVPIYVLGLSGPVGPSGSSVAVLTALIGTAWGFFIHANLRWRFGPLEWLVSTPAFHHWHHTRTGPLNRNFASTLPWLDRIFGTHHLPDAWPDAYGIKAPVPATLTEQLLHPLAPRPTSRPAVAAAVGARPVADEPPTMVRPDGVAGSATPVAG